MNILARARSTETPLRNVPAIEDTIARIPLLRTYEISRLSMHRGKKKQTRDSSVQSNEHMQISPFVFLIVHTKLILVSSKGMCKGTLKQNNILSMNGADALHSFFL